MTWRFIVVLCITLVTLSCSGDQASNLPSDSDHKPTNASPQKALERTCNVLWGMQAADGGWHSETYGILRSGQSLTPFVLHALLNAPQKHRKNKQEAIDKALVFIERNINKHGALGLSDGLVVDYPNYATSFALRCLLKTGRTRDDLKIKRIFSYLETQQYTEANGYKPIAPAYGGWGFGYETLSRGVPGHMDISHVRCVLQALHEAGHEKKQTFPKAEDFLRLVQRRSSQIHRQPKVPGEKESNKPIPYDGGFYFSPVVLGANKGRHASTNNSHRAFFRSYSTATCDGALALLACGVKPEDDRLKDARKWLEEFALIERPDGIPVDFIQPWHRAVHFYHLAVRAEACHKLNIGGSWRREISNHLVSMQAANGSFRNERSPLMKEDDPIISTTHALIALTYAMK